MKLHIFKNKEEMSEELASWICNVISETLKNQEFFSLVLSGGETPKLLFKKLASDNIQKQNKLETYTYFLGR